MQFISVIVRILFGENMHLNYNPKDGLVNRLLISLALLAVFLISTIRQFKRFLCLFIRDMKAAGIAEKIRNYARLQELSRVNAKQHLTSCNFRE